MPLMRNKTAQPAATIALFLIAALPGQRAQAADECGVAPVGPDPTVVCADTGLNPYPGGITYTATNDGLTLRIEPGIIVNRTPGEFNTGVALEGTSTAPVRIFLSEGVTITTDGGQASGVSATGHNDVFVTSAASITTRADVTGIPDFIGPYGIIGSIVAASSGDIDLRLLEQGSIVTDGEYAVGIYGLHYGNGRILISADGNIRTDGLSSEGILAHVPTPGAATSITITQSSTSRILTTGLTSSAIWTPSAGVGDILIDAAGSLETTADGASGIHASLSHADPANLGTITVNLHAGAEIITAGDNATGILADSRSLGATVVDTAGTISTAGAQALGIAAFVTGATNAAGVTVTLRQGASVTTAGTSATGIGVENNGLGAVAVNVAGALRTGGLAAYGVYALSNQAANAADVTVDLQPGADIATLGNDAVGIGVDHGGSGAAVARLAAGTSVTTAGADADAILVRHAGLGAATVDVAGAIRTSGVLGRGIRIEGDNAANASAVTATLRAQGSITTEASDATAIHIYNRGAGTSAIDVAGTIRTDGGWARGARIVVHDTNNTGGGRIALLTDAAITTLGDASYGIEIQNAGLGPAAAAVAGSIRTSGNDAHAISLANQAAGNASALEVTVAPGAIITTAGDNARGVEASHAGLGDTRIDIAGSVRTSGGFAHGSLAWISNGASTAATSVMLRAEGKIVTEGDSATAIVIQSEARGAAVADVSGSIRTEGFWSRGVRIFVSEPGNTGGAAITHARGSEIVTTGEQGSGLEIENLGIGPSTITSGGRITTTAAWANGIRMRDISPTAAGTMLVDLLPEASIETVGQSATGIQFSSDGDHDITANIAGSILTGGDSARGVSVHALGGAGASEPLTIRLLSGGRIVTHGFNSAGIEAASTAAGDLTVEAAGNLRTMGDLSQGILVNADLAASVLVDLRAGADIATQGDTAAGIGVFSPGGGTATVRIAAGVPVITAGMRADGVWMVNTGAGIVEQAAGSRIGVSGEDAVGIQLFGPATVRVDGQVTASGRFGTGVSAHEAGAIHIGGGAVVAGGWQSDSTGLPPAFARPAAGVIASGGDIVNAGGIQAGSDRAIADHGRWTGAPGRLRIDNAGSITGFVELAGGGANHWTNRAGAVFDLRHFADTDGDGVRDTKRVAIADFGGTGSAFDNQAGSLVRLAAVTGNVATDAAGYYVPTAGIVSQKLDAEFYTLARPGVVQAQMVGLGEFRHAGTLDLRGAAAGNTLVITGNPAAGGAPGGGVFVADGGQVLLNAGAHNGVAYADALVVDGTRLGSGASTIVINRRAGGVVAGNGMLLVEVRDAAASAPGVFALAGDYTLAGRPALILGAQSYMLEHHGVAGDAADGNWYLRASEASPAVTVYENYVETLRPLLTVPTLLQRVGSRVWVTPQENRAPEDASALRPDGSGFWTRVEGWYGQHDLGDARDASTRTWRMQAGYDHVLREDADGTLIGALTVQYGTATSTTARKAARGRIETTGYGVGTTLTWYGAGGFYGDFQGQLAWFDSDLRSTTTQRVLADGNNGSGYVASLELGQRFEAGPGWRLIPQGQLIYSSVDFDSFTDPFGARVQADDGDSLRARAGLTLEYQDRPQDDEAARVNAYGTLNLHTELLGNSGVDVAGTGFSSGRERVWGSLDLGASYGDARYALYAEASVSTGMADFGASHVIGGRVGVRIKW